MPIFALRAAPTSGKNGADSGGFYLSRYAHRYALWTSGADWCDLERMVRVLCTGTAATRLGLEHSESDLQFIDESGRVDSDDVDSPARSFLGTVSRFDLCEDYASGFHVEFPDRHVGVDGWDGGVHTYYRRPDWEYDRDDTEREPNDTK